MKFKAIVLLLFVPLFFVGAACDEPKAPSEDDEKLETTLEEERPDSTQESDLQGKVGWEMAEEEIRRQAQRLGVTDPCDEVEPEALSDLVAISGVEVYRGGADILGSHLVGCVTNRSDEKIERLLLGYKAGRIQGTTQLSIPNLAPGESAVFVSSIFRRGSDYYEERQIDSMELVFAQPTFDAEEADFDPPLSVGIPARDRPTHPLEEVCRGIDGDDGDGEVWVSHAEFERTGSPNIPNYRVVGCVTNRSDAVIADGSRNQVRVTYTNRAAATRGTMAGGMGGLIVDGPIEPGESAFFVSSFEVEEIEPHVDFVPFRMGAGDGEELGPQIVLEK